MAANKMLSDAKMITIPYTYGEYAAAVGVAGLWAATRRLVAALVACVLGVGFLLGMLSLPD